MVSTKARYLPNCNAASVLICQNPKAIVGVVLILFLLAIFQIYNPYTGELKVGVDPSEQALLGPNHEGWEFYQSARRNFGSDETIMVAVDADDVFSPQSIDLISRLTARLSKIPGVEKVVSMTSALTIRATDYGMDIAPIMEKVPETPEEFDVLRSDVMANPLITSSLISAENNTTAIIVNLGMTQDQKFFTQVNSAVDAIVKEEAQGTRVWVTGSTRIKHATTEIVLNDLINYPPLITVVMMVLLWLMLRSIAGVLVPLITVIISVVWTLATITTLGYSLNILTALVPPLLMILTLSYSMYFVSDFLQALRTEKVGEGEDQHSDLRRVPAGQRRRCGDGCRSRLGRRRGWRDGRCCGPGGSRRGSRRYGRLLRSDRGVARVITWKYHLKQENRTEHYGAPENHLHQEDDEFPGEPPVAGSGMPPGHQVSAGSMPSATTRGSGRRRTRSARTFNILRTVSGSYVIASASSSKSRRIW